jgi:hypothetical protein
MPHQPAMSSHTIYRVTNGNADARWKRTLPSVASRRIESLKEWRWTALPCTRRFDARRDRLFVPARFRDLGAVAVSRSWNSSSLPLRSASRRDRFRVLTGCVTGSILRVEFGWLLAIAVVVGVSAPMPMVEVRGIVGQRENFERYVVKE